MANHADNDFRAAAKALLDVVAPAIDAHNPLARQQLKLVVDWLDFYRTPPDPLSGPPSCPPFLAANRSPSNLGNCPVPFRLSALTM